VTHDQVEAMTMADRIVVMNAGRIEQIGTPEEVYERPLSRFVARFHRRGQRRRPKHAGGNRVQIAGMRSRSARANSPARQGHELLREDPRHGAAARVSRERPECPAGRRAQPGYLGSQRDYIIDVGQEVLGPRRPHSTCRRGRGAGALPRAALPGLIR